MDDTHFQSSNTHQDVDHDNIQGHPVAAASAEAEVVGTTTTAVGESTGVGGEENGPDTSETVPLPKRRGGGRALFLASKGTPVIADDDKQQRCLVTTAAAAEETVVGSITAAAEESIDAGRDENVDAAARHEEPLVGVEAARPEPTTVPSPPIWAAYLAPERPRVDAIEAVNVVVMEEDTDVRGLSRWALLFGEFLLVGAVIAISLLWMRDKSGDRSAVLINDPPSSSPTTILSSTGRFADIVREIMAHFESPTLIQDLKNPESPQYRAALWMAEEDDHPATANLTYPLNQTSLDLLQFRQRYALVTFYYATDGDGWKNLCNFLTPSLHVCDWNCRQTSPVCYTGCEYRTENNLTGVTCGWTDETDPVLNNLVTRLELGKCAGCIGAQLTAWSLLI